MLLRNFIRPLTYRLYPSQKVVEDSPSFPILRLPSEVEVYVKEQYKSLVGGSPVEVVHPSYSSGSSLYGVGIKILRRDETPLDRYENLSIESFSGTPGYLITYYSVHKSKIGPTITTRIRFWVSILFRGLPGKSQRECRQETKIEVRRCNFLKRCCCPVEV